MAKHARRISLPCDLRTFSRIPMRFIFGFRVVRARLERFNCGNPPPTPRSIMAPPCCIPNKLKPRRRGLFFFPHCRGTKRTLDASGEPQPPLTNIQRSEKSELNNLFPAGLSNRVYETDGKTILKIGIEIWAGDDEFTAVAIAKDGSSHPANNLFTGLITAGDNYDLAFDLPVRDVRRFEISRRKFDQYAPFADLSLRPGHETPAKLLAIRSLGRGSYFDVAFYEKLFNENLGGNIEPGTSQAPQMRPLK